MKERHKEEGGLRGGNPKGGGGLHFQGKNVLPTVPGSPLQENNNGVTPLP